MADLPGVSRETAAVLAQALTAMYADAEERVVAEIARHLAAGMDRPQWAQDKLQALTVLQRWLRVLLDRLGRDTSGEVTRTLLAAYAAGGTEALRALAAAQNTLPEWIATAAIEPGPKVEALLAARNAALAAELSRAVDAFPGLAALQRLAVELTTRVTATHLQILRWTEDTYRAAVTAGAAQTILGTATRRQATQAALDRLIAQGVTGFVDVAGRRWNLASYVEMATRTAVAHAAINGHLDRLTDNRRDLVIVSNSPQECELCRPWEGKILTITAGGAATIERPHATRGTPTTVHIAGSVAEATVAGLFHPNAILGDQPCGVLGEVENAVRAWYEGPSVHLTTARGKRLTVSPNHPVLTATGWLAAERVREGMYVLSGPSRELDGPSTPPSEDLDDAPASFEEVLDSLATHGLRTSVAAAADDFHGDGRSYKGEVSVVWAERALLDILEPNGIQELRELVLLGPGVEPQALTGRGALLACGHSVAGSVAGALADLNTSGSQASSKRVLADAEDVSEILAGLACGVTPDEVVNVERDWYRGHAYDLQTTTGAYLTGDIVVHNCRHTLSLYLPGVTRIPQNTEDPEGDAARQQLRYLERRVRAWRLRGAAALDDTSRRRAAAYARAWQARIRQHVAATRHLGIFRKPERERINLGHNLGGRDAGDGPQRALA